MFIVDILKNKNIKENVKVAFKAMYTCGGGGGGKEREREHIHTLSKWSVLYFLLCILPFSLNRSSQAL
jgi:hypothetical protein